MRNENNKIPSSVEAEMALLGAIISNSNKLYEIIEFLSPEEFYFSRHRELYKNILEMNNNNIPIDSITIGDYLYKKKALQGIGGISYIMELENSSLRNVNVNYYGKIIKDAYKLRTVLDVSDFIRKLVYDNSEVDEIINKACHKLSLLNFTKNSMKHISESLSKTINKIEENYKNGGDVGGLKTNFINLDKTIGGLQTGNLIILAGEPSVGKTTFTLNIIDEVSKKNMSAFFSFKMSEKQLIEKMLSSNCNISISKIKNGNLSIDEFDIVTEEVNNLSKRNIMLYDYSSLSVSEIREKCKRIKNNDGLDIIIIDYLQLIRGDERYSRVQQINNIIRELKIMAKELNICVLAITQLSKPIELGVNKRPLLSDLREVGLMEQYADVIMFLWRDDFNNEGIDKKEICEILISKNKNGQLKTINLKWNSNNQTFSNI